MILLASLTPIAVHMGSSWITVNLSIMRNAHTVRIDEEHGRIWDEIDEDSGKLVT